MDDEAGRIEQIAPLASKLLHETERLRRDVARLHQRIEPFEGEPVIPDPEFPPERPATVSKVIEMIAAARRGIIACERDLSAIRSAMDTIEKDAVSRADMKPFIRR